jgi:glycosyltransferase involved in cell wall biosynthesis
MKKFKVDVSVIGRFHAFNLAKSLQDSNSLNMLFSTLPYRKAKIFGIKKENYVSALICEIIVRILRKIKYLQAKKVEHSYHNCYINSLNNYIKDSKADIFICFAGISLDAMKIAKEKGMIIILERGSSHRRFQQNILREEYERQGIKTCRDFTEKEEVFQREMKEYELADYISIPSSFAKRTFLEEGISEKKLLVNPYGVDLSEFKQIQKEDNIFRIIYVGGLTIQKGSPYLLQAFSELNLPNSELLHLGSVNEELKPFIKKFKNEKIKLLGHKPQNELYKYYSQGSLFILPSIQDGFGMVIFQAMACGLPVILSENTGGYDAITKDGEEGFVIPIRNIEAIKEKVLYLYNNQDIAKEMGEKAKLRVSKGFSWEDYGNRYIKNLEEIYAAKN